MDLQRQEYPALLASLEPEQAIDVLQSRVSVINRVNTDIADWLLERRRIEEIYAASLRKLSRRPQQDGGASLGVFQMPWQRIISNVENMAQSHETFAAKIEADIEGPLRQYAAKNREMQSMSNISGNLQSIAKDLTTAQRKAQKLDAKGGNKAEDAKAKEDEASGQWESQAPFVFEQLQSLDESRVNHLRDVLTQLQTHELDQVERQRASAESCLNALLNVETADEIKMFATRTKEQRPIPATRRRDSQALEPTRSSTVNVPPAPPPPRNAHLEQRNSAFAQDRVGPLPDTPKEKEKSKLGGLKRLGTVMGRRKSAAPPPPPQGGDRKKEKRFPFRRGDSSRSFQDLDETGEELTTSASREQRTGSSRGVTEPGSRQDSRPFAAASPPAVNGTAPILDTVIPATNDAPILPPVQPSTGFTESYTISSSQPAPAHTLTTQSPEPINRPDPFAAATIDAPSSPGEDSARNFTIRDKPIQDDASEAQLAMSNMASQLRLQAQTSGLNRVQGSVRGRRDVRNTMFVPTTPEVGAALSATATPSIGAPSTPGSTNTAPTVATAATAPTTAPSTTTGSASDLVTPVKRTLGTGVIPEDQAVGSDAQSVHSTQSAAIARHPELHSPGLNASVIETISTWFNETGITRSFIIGEVALAYNPVGSAASPSTEIVRLQNFHQLEKCAQNPTFVTPTTSVPGTAEEQAGTYTVALSSISRPIPTTAFKYQLHINDAARATFSPLLITPAWQLVEGTASVIFLYSLNPVFSNASHTASLTLKNVTVTVALDVKSEEGARARPTFAQMMPVQGASFKKRAGSVIWRFPELVIKQTQERLLVRFQIENNAVAKQGGVEVKFEAIDTSASALGVERYAAPGTAAEADPFADEDEGGSTRRSAEAEGRWEEVRTKRMLVSGRYTVE